MSEQEVNLVNELTGKLREEIKKFFEGKPELEGELMEQNEITAQAIQLLSDEYEPYL